MKIKRWILPALAGLILGLSLYRWNAETLTGNKMPMPFGYGASVVLSGSMEPSLNVGDLVVIRRTGQVQPGDVVVYQSENLLVIHRVISVTEDAIVTQGDANNVSDDPITPEDVKGVMVLAIPGVGTAVLALKKPPVTLALLLAALLLNERAFRRERKEQDQELDDLKAELRSLAEEMKKEQ